MESESPKKCPNCGSENIAKYPNTSPQYIKQIYYCEKCDTNIENVFEFIYNPNLSYGSWGTISIHKYRKNAEIALEWHKHNCLIEWERLCKEYPPAKEFPFDFDQDWFVRESYLID